MSGIQRISMPSLGGQHVPRDDVGVVFHLGEHDDVAVVEVGPAPRVGDEIDRLGGVLGEDDLVGTRRIDEAGDRVAAVFVGVGGLAGEPVRAAVDRCVRLLEERRHGVDDLTWLLGRVARVEVHDRRAVDLAAEDRELLADRGDVERHRGQLPFTIGRAGAAGRADGRAERVVAVAFELLGEFHAAGGDDAAVDQDVDAVGGDLVEEALVVRDEHDTHGRPVDPDLANALGDDAQRVDVETRVGLVEDREFGFEDRHLHDLVALLLAA